CPDRRIGRTLAARAGPGRVEPDPPGGAGGRRGHRAGGRGRRRRGARPVPRRLPRVPQQHHDPATRHRAQLARARAGGDARRAGDLRPFLSPGYAHMTMKRSRACVASVALVVALTSVARAADEWARFRGPDGSGVSRDVASIPAKWTDKDLRWKVALP